MTKPMPVEDVLALLALQAEYADGADSFSGETYARSSPRMVCSTRKGYEIPGGS